MNRTTRILAAFLLALLLPMQGFAAACAQICAAAQAHDSVQAEAKDHCGKNSDMGAGKCCKAHAFMIDVTVPHLDGVEPYHAHSVLIARWTSFIPEEPSPPPID